MPPTLNFGISQINKRKSTASFASIRRVLSDLFVKNMKGGLFVAFLFERGLAFSKLALMKLTPDMFVTIFFGISSMYVVCTYMASPLEAYKYVVVPLTYLECDAQERSAGASADHHISRCTPHCRRLGADPPWLSGSNTQSAADRLISTRTHAYMT